MKRGYCIGGPSHGKLMSVKHGARLVDVSTGATYLWVDGQWHYEPKDDIRVDVYQDGSVDIGLNRIIWRDK
tara:strand:+ start:1146 stop:1358 length:213 start_codon:yes stop_codon:yes gene_type:complete